MLLIPGWKGSGKGHWQAIWREENIGWRWVEQRDWEAPECTEWANGIDSAIAQSDGPIVAVAHSLGCIAFASWFDRQRQTARRRIIGAFFVAPADAQRIGTPHLIRGFAPIPHNRIPLPTMLMASENDPCMAFRAARSLATRWGSIFVNAGPVGHINVASGHGPWPAGRVLLSGFLQDIAAPVFEMSRKSGTGTPTCYPRRAIGPSRRQ